MTQVSARLASLSPSATLAMSQKSSELKAQGVDVINLSVGEPDFNTPEPIKDAAKKAIDENYSRYSPVAGYPALRNAIVAKLKNENGLEYTANQISCANGAKQSVCNTIMVLVNPGDEVIIPAPFWVSYPEMVKLAEGTPVIVAAGIEQDFKITPAQLETAITPKTKALILCSPSNPTGSVYSAEELAGLAEVLKKHPEIIVIADEIYEHINYIGKHNSIAQIDGMKDRTVIVKRCFQSLCHDRMAYRFHCRTGMDRKGSKQIAGTIYFRTMLRIPESGRSCLHRFTSTGRRNAPGIRTPPQLDCRLSERDSGIRSKSAGRSFLPVPQNVAITLAKIRRYTHDRECR